MSLDRYRARFCQPKGCAVALDASLMGIPDSYLEAMAAPMAKALAAMQALEAGAIANPDENRMVGHYWLRAPELAPMPELRAAIARDIATVKDIAARVHSGALRPPTAERFRTVLVIGIGGSALGPQLVADALSAGAADRMRMAFLDNTDPDGMERVLAALDPAETLAVVISKSGGTPETRNGMLVARDHWQAAGLDFSRHAMAVTGEGSRLDRQAQDEGFLARLPMYDWVGGRTSVMSAVGLLPMALQGLDTDAFLAGARAMDAHTRAPELRANPAALLATCWHHATGGHGAKDMVVLPYSDRLLLFSRYLQQLVMESLGKERDLDGRVVHQGIAVYGNKGSTDQHAYVQQLREGVANFFAVFVEVLHKGGRALEVEPGATSGDYLHGFLLGTRRALAENGRASLTLTVERVDAATLGALVALFERAVGLYAALVNINAYHQPGVEAGKKAAAAVLALQQSLAALARSGKAPRGTAEAWAAALGADTETVFLTLRHMAHNGGPVRATGDGPDAEFSAR
jgi:glucose-6-phosphate isomerase